MAEEPDRKDIEVVRRFVEEKAIGFRNEYFRELHPELISPRKAMRRLGKRLFAEPQSQKKALDFIEHLFFLFLQSEGRLFQNRGLSEADMLPQDPDPVVPRQHDRPLIGFLFTRYQSE